MDPYTVTTEETTLPISERTTDLTHEVSDIRRLLHSHRHTTADRTQPLEFSDISTITFTSIASFTPEPQYYLNIITAQSAAITINNPLGTYKNGKRFLIRIKDDATPRAISFGTQYRASTSALPTTTTASKHTYMGFMFNEQDTKWDLLAVTTTV